MVVQRSLSWLKEFSYNVVRDFADEHLDDYTDIIIHIASGKISEEDAYEKMLEVASNLIDENFEVIKEDFQDFIREELSTRLFKDVELYKKEFKEFEEENN